MCLWSLRRKDLGFYSQQPRNRGKSKQDKSRARHATAFKHQRSSTPNRENKCAQQLRGQGQRQMSAFLPGFEKGLPMGCPLRRSIHSTKNLPKLSPILVSPSERELLTLYLAVSDFSTSVALVREQDRVQYPVYYCSQALRGAEERYPKMEKLILVLVTTARKLRPYFQAHTIEVPTEHPMK